METEVVFYNHKFLNKLFKKNDLPVLTVGKRYKVEDYDRPNLFDMSYYKLIDDLGIERIISTDVFISIHQHRNNILSKIVEKNKNK